MPAYAARRDAEILEHRPRSAAAVLSSMLAAPDSYAGVTVAEEAGRYTRTLVWSDWDISVWLMRWAPGCRTPIHDHHCTCSYALVSGALTEVRYRPCGGDLVEQTARRLRVPGASIHLQPHRPNIHQMINDSAKDALSLHVYGFDPSARANSIERVYVSTSP